MIKTVSNFLKKNYVIIIIIAAVTTVYIFTGCPIRFLTGFCCPGCGMTRAALSLAKFDFSGALYYHPMVYSLPVILLLIIGSKAGLISKRVLNAALIVWGIAMTAVYAIRLFSGSEVVFADYTRGIIFRMYERISR